MNAIINAGWMEDWLVIENSTGTGQPEGSTEEWRQILATMRNRERLSFRRVAVRFGEDGRAWFWSPRNSMDESAASVQAENVDEWIASAEKLVDWVASKPVS